MAREESLEPSRSRGALGRGPALGAPAVMPALRSAGRGCPLGRKTSTRIRTTNTIACDQRGMAERGGEHLDEADDEAAERGAGDVADAAEDGGRERLQAGDEAEVEPDDAEVQALERRRPRRPAPRR